MQEPTRQEIAGIHKALSAAAARHSRREIKVINNCYDEGAYVPSIAYILGYFNSTTFSLAVDTGSGRSLISKTFWDSLDSHNEYELEPYLQEFIAVNKTGINCHGSVMIQLMLLGKEKNYVGYFKFFIVDDLSFDAIIGLDEIYRHDLQINTTKGFVNHNEAGKLISNLCFRWR